MANALDRVSVAAIGTSIADLETETVQAEVAGVECVWAPELFRSSVTQAAYLAGRTEKIGVAKQDGDWVISDLNVPRS